MNVFECFKELVNIINTIQPEIIIMSGCIVFIIWVYKEIRLHLIENEKDNADRINKALEIYGRLILMINHHLNDNDQRQLLNDELYKTLPYLPKDLVDLVYDASNKENLQQLLEELRKEVKSIKSLQYDIVSSGGNGKYDHLEFIYKSCKKLKLGSFFIPLLVIYLILVFASYLINFSNIVQKAEGFHQYSLIFGFSSSIVKLFIVIPDVVTRIMQKKLVSNAFNWFILVLLLIVPFIFIKFIKIWYL
ncbi:MAG: hypothetical protein GX638_01730, partial [Crenarchaeota archaeon]|nr:hypothetical protein [Thermoproteota archaeon]